MIKTVLDNILEHQLLNPKDTKEDILKAIENNKEIFKVEKEKKWLNTNFKKKSNDYFTYILCLINFIKYSLNF